MKKSSFLCVLMAVALLSGCSKSELVGPAGIEAGQIALRSSITDVNASLTRAPYEGATSNISATNPLAALVLTSLAQKDYTNPYAKGTMTFTGTDLTAYNSPVVGSAYFSDYTGTGSTPHYLTGLYPATGWTVASDKATLTLTGKEDVMFAPEANTTYTNRSTSPAILAFTHKLTQLKLAVAKASGFSDEVILTGAKVISSKEGLYSQAVATLNTNQGVSFVGEIIYPINTAGIAFWTKGDDGTDQAISSKTVSNTTETIAYTLVSPDEFEANEKNYTLAITYTHGGITYTDREVDVTLTAPSVSNGSTAGYSFLVTLTFNEGNIVAKANVANWATGDAVAYPF